MDKLITFQDVAKAIGTQENHARITLSLPPLSEGILHFRVFCLADALIKRQDLKRYSKFTFGEVVKIINISNEVPIALIQFDICTQPFPLEMHRSTFVGDKDSIIMNLRRLERELPDRIISWSKLTGRGMINIGNSEEALRDLKNRMNVNKTSHRNR